MSSEAFKKEGRARRHCRGQLEGMKDIEGCKEGQEALQGGMRGIWKALGE